MLKKSLIIIFIIIIAIIILLILTLCGCFNNDDQKDGKEDDGEFKLIIEKAEITNLHQDIKNNTTSFDFDFEIRWKNLPVNISEIAFKIEFISDDEWYFYDWSRWVLYNNSENALERHKDFIMIGIISIPEKYRIELHWRNEDNDIIEFRDSIEKDYKQ